MNLPALCVRLSLCTDTLGILDGIDEGTNDGTKLVTTDGLANGSVVDELLLGYYAYEAHQFSLWYFQGMIQTLDTVKWGMDF